MKHSYSNDNTCFSIDVIDEILEEDFDALLDEGSKILYSIEGTLLDEEIFVEFDEFVEMTVDVNSNSKSNTEELPFKKITVNINYKIKTSLEEPPTNLELKPLPGHLEYVFLEEPSFLPVIISSQLSKEKKDKLVSVLKIRKQAFAWKTIDIPGICPSFCKHKIQLLEDKKPVVQKQRRLNPNMQEIVKKEIVKLLDTEGILLGQKVSSEGLEVDKAKIDVISKLPPLTNIKEFNIEIKDRKGAKNVTADHLSRVENDETNDDSEVDDNFPGETLMEVNTKNQPWFADFANYLVGDVIPKGMTYQQKNNFFSDLKHYFWEEPYLFKGIDFMGPFPKSYKFEYILVVVDYVLKWAEAQALPTNDAKVVVTFLKKLFCHFGMPKALISNQGTHFFNKIMERTMKRYGVNHRFSTSYHPQTSGQVENTNRALKRILEKTVKDNPTIWSRKLDDALWPFRTAYKTSYRTKKSPKPYKLVILERTATYRLKLNTVHTGH
ncbi:reverse transcriptase domain-containing protein [Tanacetum coccineum]|uniref:Reverse transcriptase domain-containing protein n=1 Tax=Tanacetum coccineum TaxID=301880 RepID=A0ABQ4ZIK8_9ASTR